MDLRIFKHKVYKSSDTNVSKFVFESDGGAMLKPIAVEAVLYRYNSYKNRTVICCSTQCGCPVGCVFCGTGKFYVRNLTDSEIVEQIDTALSYIDCKPNEIEKFQIMFMSMGEPFLNYNNLEKAIIELNKKYPNAQLLVSTSAPIGQTINCFPKFIELARQIDKVGIQFSVHESNDDDRRKLIPTSTMSLGGIASLGERFALKTGRKPFFNYCVHHRNSGKSNVTELIDTFEPAVWECTLSVICERDSTMQAAIESQLDRIKAFSQMMIKAGYSIRVFNPAGQDDIGGGCGQLWYFQEWRNKNKNLCI